MLATRERPIGTGTIPATATRTSAFVLPKAFRTSPTCGVDLLRGGDAGAAHGMPRLASGAGIAVKVMARRT